MPLLSELPSSTPHDAPKKQDATAYLTYTIPPKPLARKPRQVVPGFLDDPGTTVELSFGAEEIIHDVRGSESTFTLEENGFCFVKHHTTFTDWDRKRKIEDHYCNREMVDLIFGAMGGKEKGVDEVIIFHQGRRSADLAGQEANDGQRTNPFARQVHLDQTEPTIIARVRSATEIKADWALQGRVRQVNVWRPLFHPVYDCGLCVADSKSLEEGDVVEIDRVKPDGSFFDTMGGVRWREGYRWWYKSFMEPDDVLMFMGYDSECARKEKPGLGYTFHSAFDIPNPPPNSPTRQSIEVRALVLTWPRDTPLRLDPPPPGRLSVSTPQQTCDDDLEDTFIRSARTLRFVDLDDLSFDNAVAGSEDDELLFVVRQDGKLQIINLHDHPKEWPRHPLHDSIMMRVQDADDTLCPSRRKHDDGDELDVISRNYKRRLSVSEMKNKSLEKRITQLERELQKVKLEKMVLMKRVEDPELML